MYLRITVAVVIFGLGLCLTGCRRSEPVHENLSDDAFAAITNTFSIRVKELGSGAHDESVELLLTSELKSDVSLFYGFDESPLKKTSAGEAAVLKVPLTNAVVIITNGVYLDGTMLVLATNEVQSIRLVVWSNPALHAAEQRRNELQRFHSDLMKGPKATTSDDLSAGAIDALIKDLHSENMAFGAFGGEFVKVPRNYEFAAHKKVYLAETALAQIGVPAFSKLVENFDNGAYCQTDLWNGFGNDLTVGQICRRIVSRQIEVVGWPYGKLRELGDDTIAWTGSFSHLVAKYGGHRGWIKASRYRTLKEMQIEALECSIEREKKFGFKDIGEEKRILGKLESALRELKSQ